MTAVETPTGPRRADIRTSLSRKASTTAEAGDAEGQGGDQGDGSEQGRTAGDRTQLGAAIGVDRENSVPAATSAPAYPIADSMAAPARTPTRFVTPEVEGIASESSDVGAPTWNTEAPPIRCESTETISKTTCTCHRRDRPGA